MDSNPEKIDGPDNAPPESKRIARRNLPINVKYELVDTFSTGGIENAAYCENCGRPIVDVAVIQNPENKQFQVGMDCAETLAGIADSLNFISAAAHFNEAKGIRRKVNKELKGDPAAYLTVENTPDGKVKVAVESPGKFSLLEEYVDKPFLFSYIPDYEAKISNPDKNSFVPPLPDDYDFGVDFRPIFSQGTQSAGRRETQLVVAGYTVDIIDERKQNTKSSGEVWYSPDIFIYFKDSAGVVVAESHILMWHDIPRTIRSRINELVFNAAPPAAYPSPAPDPSPDVFPPEPPANPSRSYDGPSNLTPEQREFVRTDLFKKWFGDWEDNPGEASKMLDENGEPKIFYHGSEHDFHTFDKKKIGSATDPGWLGAGFYFYGVLDQAQQYGNVKEFFLNIRNPYPATGKQNADLAEKNTPKASKAFSKKVQGEGYDGVYYNGDLREETVIFEPDQIMSADGMPAAENNKEAIDNELKSVSAELGIETYPAPDNFNENAKQEYRRILGEVLSGEKEYKWRGKTIEDIATAAQYAQSKAKKFNKSPKAKKPSKRKPKMSPEQYEQQLAALSQRREKYKGAGRKFRTGKKE